MNDDVQNMLNVFHQLRIRNSKHLVALCADHLVAAGVPQQVCIAPVLTSIQFDDEPSAMICEVEEITPKRHLATDMESVVVRFAQSGPKLALHLGGVVTKLS